MSVFTTAISGRLPQLTRPYHAAAAGLFVVLGALLFGPYLSSLPEGTHVWAQTDRLALALNFYDFGFDFWHPRTSSLQSIGGITGVEFPLQPYLAALGGLVAGRSHIVTAFRVLDVTMNVVGLWYLFRLVFERTGSFAAGLLPGAFLLASPTFTFYAASALPDPFSFSLTLVGYYYWLRFFDQSARFADLQRALLILVLAALVKTTSGLHLMAVSGITLLYVFLEPDRLTPRDRVRLLLTLGVGAALLIGFYLHNLQLNTTYQSHQFLAAAMPAEGVITWHEYMRVYKAKEGGWRYEYLLPSQYYVLLAAVLVCLARARRAWQHFRFLTLLVLASLAVAWLFYQLMGSLLAVHDYYAICSFLPPVVLVLLLAVLLLVPPPSSSYPGRAGWGRPALTGGLLLLAGYLTHASFGHFASRMSDNYPTLSDGYTHRWMRGGAALLQQAGVPAQAQVLVLDDYSSNISLVYFDRRGRTTLHYRYDMNVAGLVKYMSADSLDYLIMKPDTYQRLTAEPTALAEAFAPVLHQSAVVVLRRRHLEQAAW
ncbi:hypothetical protein [uncultured Hymenobacter sp.]|uniref:hypothetical protein n=1 Tax=uncultured Hymenobacter sp. TaxID=170016 RepID=UPI0035CBE69B